MTLSVVIAGDGKQALPLAGVDEVIAVLPASSESPRVDEGAAVRRVRSEAPVAQRANIGISLASGDWVLVLDGRERLMPDWRQQAMTALSNGAACVQRFVPGSGGAPRMAVWRQAFAYGALDGVIDDVPAAMEGWLTHIFPQHRHRVLPREGSETKQVAWLETERAARTEPRDKAALKPEDGSYRPRQFWEAGGSGWVKWEAYQPDEPEIRALVERTQPRHVIELGCGGGRNGRYFGMAQWYAGLDISFPLLEKARDRQPDNSAGLVCGDATSLPFASGAADLVFAVSTIQHVEPHRIDHAVHEIVRVSRRYIGLIEFTDEMPGQGRWFSQPHMFKHDYEELFRPHASLLSRRRTTLQVQPAVKEAFLFEKAA